MGATAAETRAKPIVGILLGDPSGVGPELVVKLLARRENLTGADVILFADPKVLAMGEKAAGVALDVKRVAGIDDLGFEAGRPTLVPFDWIAEDEIEIGRATIASGRASSSRPQSANATCSLGAPSARPG